MCQGRDISELLEAGDHAGAAQKFLELGLIAEGVDPLAHGGGNVAKAGFQYVEDRLLAAFLTPLLAALLAALFSGESFEAGDVGHGIGVLESIDLFSQGDNKLLGQRHQPVDQAQQVPCLEFGVALAAELASELEAVFRAPALVRSPRRGFWVSCGTTKKPSQSGAKSGPPGSPMKPSRPAWN
jgi:hypothetical protein